MGYADTLPYQSLELWTGIQDLVVCTTVPTDFAISSFTIPSFKRPISYAYVDLIAMTVADFAGVNNNFVSGSFGITDSGATYRAANTLDNGTWRIPANGYQRSYNVYPGVNDLSAYVTAGSTQAFSLDNVVVLGDPLWLRDVCGRMRLYFNV